LEIVVSRHQENPHGEFGLKGKGTPEKRVQEVPLGRTASIGQVSGDDAQPWMQASDSRQEPRSGFASSRLKLERLRPVSNVEVAHQHEERTVT